MRRAARVALLFVIPYLLLGLAWIGSNPPGAAPDESDHLAKAIGIATLDVGRRYTGPPEGDSPLDERNVLTSRVVAVPATLAPEGYNCMAFRPQTSVACLPDRAPADGPDVQWVTPVGSHPPFLHLPLGLAARAADSPPQAFSAARLVALVMSCSLLFLGAFQLARWLGRWALLGAFLAITPMAVSIASAVSTSGIEITAAFAVAAVVIVAPRRPESLTQPATALVLAVAGAALVLSRDLGAVDLATLLAVLVVGLGPGRLLALIRERPRPLLACGAALVLALVAVASWQLRYNQPPDSGSLFASQALDGFATAVRRVATSGIGEFGWMDTPLPGVVRLAWGAALALLCGAAVVLGTARDRASIVGVTVVVLAITYVLYAVVFAPLGAFIQGRHILPLVTVLPLLAGVVVVEQLARRGWTAALRPLYLAVAVLVAGTQLFSVYWNARRNAVGLGAEKWFLGSEEWSPPWGWVFWLLLATAAAVSLAVVAVRSRPGRLLA